MDIYVDVLDSKSIDEAIKQIEAYKEKLEPKLQEVKEIACRELEEMVQEGFNGAPYDYILGEGYQDADVKVTSNAEEGTVTAEGVAATFVEFGAGVHMGGVYPGTRPEGIKDLGEYGKGYGKRKVWGFYVNGELKKTRGTPNSAPMYHATQAMKEEIENRIGKEVFEDLG